MEDKKTKNINPLYVVNKNKIDVETAENFIELILKKMGLGPFCLILKNIIDSLLSQVTSYPMFLAVKKICDEIFERIIEIIFQIQQYTQKKKI